ncbi:hypothetical protein HanRHA438_Chr09g0375731 [Helianthus annuus]|nr:hypothetical protein HanRHA438_Chr09g0375731 [Helianthus annuus]
MDEAEVDAIDQFMLEELKKMKSLSGKLYELIKIYNLRQLFGKPYDGVRNKRFLFD